MAKPSKAPQNPQDGGPSAFCSFTKWEETAKVSPNPRNPNRHPESQIRMLAKVIQNQGWRSPIVVSARSGFVVKGHGRLAAAKLAGMTHVPIDLQEYESEALEYADLVADNRLAELAEMSLPALKDLIGEIDTGEIDLELTGYDTAQLESLMSQFKVEPTFEKDDVTAEDLSAAEEKLTTATERSAEQVKVLCPKCGHEFLIDRA